MEGRAREGVDKVVGPVDSRCGGRGDVAAPPRRVTFGRVVGKVGVLLVPCLSFATRKRACNRLLRLLSASRVTGRTPATWRYSLRRSGARSMRAVGRLRDRHLFRAAGRERDALALGVGVEGVAVVLDRGGRDGASARLALLEERGLGHLALVSAGAGDGDVGRSVVGDAGDGDVDAVRRGAGVAGREGEDQRGEGRGDDPSHVLNLAVNGTVACMDSYPRARVRV